MPLKVKICGITSRADAFVAIEAGADALGFVFCETSPRHLTLSAAREIIWALPPFVTRVGVFANASEDCVKEVIRECGIDTVQFHGDELPDFCRRFGPMVIKAFRIRDDRSLEPLRSYSREAWLLDSYVAGKLGGTGERFNWELARRATELSDRVILAGGLTPENVAMAVNQVRPYAVDVSSGVERSPGKKDAEKVRQFILEAKEASLELVKTPKDQCRHRT